MAGKCVGVCVVDVCFLVDHLPKDRMCRPEPLIKVVEVVVVVHVEEELRAASPRNLPELGHTQRTRLIAKLDHILIRDVA